MIIKNIKKIFISIAIFCIFVISINYIKASDVIMPDKKDAHRRDFNGEGTVVAIIDAGADINHPDLKLNNLDEIKLKKSEIEAIIKNNHLKGKYISEKIPYVYDYYHKDKDVFSRDEHGMHVAGIVGANGKIKGVAPETQLLIMKVFPDSGINDMLDNSKYYVEAIKDAILLKADVINLSLGVGAGSEAFLDDDVKNIIKSATQKGIVVNIAGGNNGYFSFMNGYPKSDNPDYGVIAMPAILKESIAVAAVNSDTLSATMLVSDGKKYPYKEAYIDALSLAGKLPYGDKIKLVNAGDGTQNDYKSIDVDGKIAIVKRGKMSFRDLQKEAARNNAKGLIIYNNSSENDELFNLNGSEFSIPVAIMRYKDAKELLKNSDVTIKFLSDEESYPNPNKNDMSVFSAYGLTNEGLLKPDITAPGGDILSLGNHEKYIRMSGTSMATPYISGVTALTMQRLSETFDEKLGPKEKFDLVKKLILSTANQHKESGILTTPRKQGSGIVSIKGALTSKVVAYADKDTININLKDVTNKLSIPVTLKNISNKNLVLKGEYHLIADDVRNGRFNLKSREVKNGKIDDVTLKPKEEKTILYDIDVKDIDLKSDMKNGYFLDGYIIFNYGQKKPAISVAFTSFKGKYEELPIIEPPIYNLKNFDATYMDKLNYSNDFTHLGSSITVGGQEKHVVLGETKDSVIGNRKFDANKIVFSPNGDGQRDELEFVFTALRTYQKITIDIYDKNGKMIETFSKIKDPNFIKNYYGGNEANPKSLILWTYKPDSSIKDGEYTAKISIKRFLDSPYTQEINYKFYIDRT